jgi:hypothetical protein
VAISWRTLYRSQRVAEGRLLRHVVLAMTTWAGALFLESLSKHERPLCPSTAARCACSGRTVLLTAFMIEYTRSRRRRLCENSEFSTFAFPTRQSRVPQRVPFSTTCLFENEQASRSGTTEKVFAEFLHSPVGRDLQNR